MFSNLMILIEIQVDVVWVEISSKPFEDEMPEIFAVSYFKKISVTQLLETKKKGL